jgi:acyl-CoA reductase-like NAD-dependent aldehyde dehydrogenase
MSTADAADVRDPADDLSATAWTRNHARAHCIARRLDAAAANINKENSK